MSDTNQSANMSVEDRLAQINQAVASNLSQTKDGNPEPGSSERAAGTCPIDPQERLLCEGCQ